MQAACAPGSVVQAQTSRSFVTYRMVPVQHQKRPDRAAIKVRKFQVCIMFPAILGLRCWCCDEFTCKH
jgi:hypothetical protein